MLATAQCLIINLMMETLKYLLILWLGVELGSALVLLFLFLSGGWNLVWLVRKEIIRLIKS